MPFHISKSRALVELIAAALMWGFGFIATRWALEGFGPLWLTAVRFIIVAVTMFPLFLILKKDPAEMKMHFKLSMWPGLLLGLTLILQTIGLKYTTVTKSGFITCLYVLFVPIGESFYMKHKIPRSLVFLIFVALVGTAFISQIQDGSLNKGDVFTLGCALAAAFQILSVGQLSSQTNSPFQMNVFQSFWAGGLALLIAIPLETFAMPTTFSQAWVGMLFLSFASTLIAFMIQIRSQKILSPTVVSMFFLLESPFAAFFAYLLFQETLNMMQWAGALMILGAAYGTIIVTSQHAEPSVKK